jgi:hypothetical protein
MSRDRRDARIALPSNAAYVEAVPLNQVGQHLRSTIRVHPYKNTNNFVYFLI